MQMTSTTVDVFCLKWILAVALSQEDDIPFVNPANHSFVGKIVAFPTGKTGVSEYGQRFKRLRPTSSVIPQP